MEPNAVDYAGSQIVRDWPYLNGTCNSLGSLPESAVCSSSAGTQIIRLAITSEDPQRENQILTVASISTGARNSIPRIGNSWAAPIAVNQSYRLDWTEPELNTLSLEVFPLAPPASIVLDLGISNTMGQIQVDTASQSLQLGQQLPSSPEASAAAYDASNRTLSLLFVGTASSQPQVFVYPVQCFWSDQARLPYAFTSASFLNASLVSGAR